MYFFNYDKVPIVGSLCMKTDSALSYRNNHRNEALMLISLKLLPFSNEQIQRGMEAIHGITRSKVQG